MGLFRILATRLLVPGIWILSGSAVTAASPSATWQAITFPEPVPITSLLEYQDRIFAGGDQGLWESRDGGAHWEAHSLGSAPGPVMALFKTGPLLFASKGKSIYRSSDEGASWSLVGALERSDTLIAFESHGDSLFALGGRFIPHERALSLDEGVSWRFLDDWSGDPGPRLFSLGADNLIRLWYGNLDASPDQGATWMSIPRDTSLGKPLAAAVGGDELFIATESGMLLRSRDSGRDWIAVLVSTRIAKPLSLAADGISLCVATLFGISCSQDGGGTFLFERANRYPVPMQAMAVGGKTIYLTNSDWTWGGEVSWKTLGEDSAWSVSGRSLGSPFPLHNIRLTARGELLALFEGTGHHQANLSRDHGATFSGRSLDGVPLVFDAAALGKTCWAISSENRIYLSADSARTWRPARPFPGTLASTGITVAERDVFGLDTHGKIWDYSFSYSTWSSVPATQGGEPITSIAASDSVLYATGPGGTFRLQLYGQSTTLIHSQGTARSAQHDLVRIRIPGNPALAEEPNAVLVDPRGRRVR